MPANSYQVYQELIKPPLSPPGWIFGPVWTLLYTMMGIACFRIITTGFDRTEVQRAVFIFIFQLGLNFLWPYLYFTLGLRGAAFAEIILLWAMIILCIWLFFAIDTMAGWLMVPYLCWVSFAAYLNGATWYLNR
ncbi:MAG: TspO/MBR family protein [Bacillota bacterium]|nr:TspO/MBR family protein [Bacillota bacterium]MDW7676319.1 TspO/MBR family protein [Bacillota bacterium]